MSQSCYVVTCVLIYLSKHIYSYTVREKNEQYQPVQIPLNVPSLVVDQKQLVFDQNKVSLFTRKTKLEHLTPVHI